MRSDTRPLAQWMENVSAASVVDYYYWETDADGWTVAAAYGGGAVVDADGWTQLEVVSLPGSVALDTVIRGDDLIRLLPALL